MTDIMYLLKIAYGVARLANNVKRTDLLLRAIMYTHDCQHDLASDLIREHALLS